MKVINDNAYRILGVFANASRKDIERNKSKFNAFLRVDKPVPSQPFDMTGLLPEINRTLETINKAEGELAVAKDKLKNVLFWFVCVDEVDEKCLRLLEEKRDEQARATWNQDGRVSSLHNLMLCHLLKGEYPKAVSQAHNIFTMHFQEWRELFSLMPDLSPVDTSHLFLDSVSAEIPKEFASMDWSNLPSEWALYVKNKSVNPLVEQVLSLVEACKQSHENMPEEKHTDASSLLEKAKPVLAKLESLLPADDVSLRSCKDSVYAEVLRCSIASYNAVFEDLEGGNADSYRQVAPLCKALVDNIETEHLSPSLQKRIQETKEVLDKNCANIEETIERTIAMSEHMCWFCGSDNATMELKKPYSYSVTEPTWTGTKTTTYTKTVTIHLCEACDKELKERKRWKNLSSVAMFAILLACLLIFTEFWHDLEVIGWLFIIGTMIALSVLLGRLTGGLFRKMMDKENIREFKRDVDDHPLVKLVKSEGYR